VKPIIHPDAELVSLLIYSRGAYHKQGISILADLEFKIEVGEGGQPVWRDFYQTVFGGD
jgi:hypothetical protein